MKKILGAFFILALNLISNAQTISNSLNGYFSTSKKDALYTSIHFDGKGHALINDGFSGEYFQLDDMVYVFPDKSVFIFKLEKDKLKGVSNWVEKQTYKLSQVPMNDDYIREFKTYKIDPDLLYQYYIQNFNKGTDEISFSVFEDGEAYLKKMEELCQKNLTSACGALFGIKLLDASGGLDAFLSEEKMVVKENKNLENIATKMIDLGDFRGYALLGSYYALIGNLDKAKALYNEGSEKGDGDSAMALFALELEEASNELEE